MAPWTGSTIILILLCITLSTALLFDIREKRIPNLITFPAIIISLTYYGILQGTNGLLFSGAGLALALALFLFPYSIGLMGAGDVKLMGAVGSMLGPSDAFTAILFTSIAGGIYGIALLLIRIDAGKELVRRSKTFITAPFCNGTAYAASDVRQRITLPTLRYGVAISVGTTAVVVLRLTTS